ncbi:alpha/beta hydrolase [Actinoplanes sp. NPDC026670]|uniref:alpha/beta fold hydrolase n=1 Tax=Actinoplanes sp. NPDC026670 TaxID=3154700 RepID=UPI0033ED2022
MTQHLTVNGGTIAYDVTGDGPLVVLVPGIGNSRRAYRFVAPRLVDAGYRVATTDLRGAGESSAQWASYSRTDIAGDILALVRHLGGPAVLVGHSISGGAVTIAAARAPEMTTGIIELAPFTRAQSFSLGDLGNTRYRKGAVKLVGTMLGSLSSWKGYLDLAYPGNKPADWSADLAATDTMLREPGRMKALQKMTQASPADAGAQLGNVRCPALIVEGTLDPDWADPRAEGEAIVAAMPAGTARLEMIDGAGHYPHAQFPDETVSLMLTFLQTNARA